MAAQRSAAVEKPEIGDETPITLREACDIAFRGIVTEASLRAEHGRGMLEIFRIGRQDFTTLRFIREMQEKIARLRNENDAQRNTIDELLNALAAAGRLSAELTEILNRRRSATK